MKASRSRFAWFVSGILAAMVFGVGVATAATGDPVLAGHDDNTADNVTRVTNTASQGIGLEGSSSNSGTGVKGNGVVGVQGSGTINGVAGFSSITGACGEVVGSSGDCEGASHSGVVGEGIRRVDGEGTAVGVVGSSATGPGVLATSTSGFALDVNGSSRLTGATLIDGNTTIDGTVSVSEDATFSG